MSPDGWWRILLWLETHPHTPSAGSIRESLFLFAMRKREQAEIYKTRMLYHALLGEKEEAAEAYDYYRQAKLPFVERMTDKEKEETKKSLDKLDDITIQLDPALLVGSL